MLTPASTAAQTTRELDDLLDELVGSPTDSRSFTTQTAVRSSSSASAGGGGRGVGGGGSTAAHGVVHASGSGAGPASWRRGDTAASATSSLAAIGDLQRAGAAQLAAAKLRMDKVYDDNRIKPGDEGYIFDKRVDFGQASEPSAWDD